jgi:hypothetical protein
MSFYLVQSISVLGFCFCLFGFLQNDDDKLKIYVSVGALLISLHFFLLGAITGSFSAFVAATRYYFSSKRFVKYSHYIFLVYICVYSSIAYFTYNTYIDAFPVVAGVIGTISIFFLKSINMRVGIIITAALWLIHNIVKFSLGGIALETMNIIVNLFTIHKIIKARHV